MKDNTLLYLGAAAVVVYIVTRPKATLPTGTVTVGPVLPLPASGQTGLSSSFMSLLSNVTKLLPSNQNVNVNNVNSTPTQATQIPLTVTDSTGVTAISSGSIYNPDYDSALDTPLILTTPIIPPVSTDVADTFDFSDDE